MQNVFFFFILNNQSETCLNYVVLSFLILLHLSRICCKNDELLRSLHSQQLGCFCFGSFMVSVGFSPGTSTASRPWRGRPSTTPCTRVRPPPATATTTAATLRFLCSAAPVRRPPRTSAARRWDTSMSTANWPRRCVSVCEREKETHCAVVKFLLVITVY